MDNETAQYTLTRYQAVHLKCPVCRKFYYAQLSKLYNAQGTVVDYLRTEQSGKTYGLASVRYLKACCGETLQARLVKGIYEETVKCGPDCFQAKSQNCTCSCGGTLHGVRYAMP